MIQRHAQEVERFFAQLYPDIQEGWLVLSQPDPDPTHVNAKGKRWLCSTWLDLAQTSLARAATIAATLGAKDTLYFGVVLQRPDARPGLWRRSTNDGAYVVPGFWFDLDLAYGQHAASTLPATDAEALDFLATLPALPSLIVHSGGGLYGHWLFKEPSLITTPAEHDAIRQLSERFTHTLITAGKLRGWTLDALGDMARILRPPGVTNFKYGKPVEVIHEDGARYNPGDFCDWLLDLPTPARTTHGGQAVTGQPNLVAIAAHYGTALDHKSQTELAGAHPQHGSSTGDNFNVNMAKQLWHCWRHGVGGDALSLIAVCEELVACEDLHPGALRGPLFLKVLDIARDQFGMDTTPHRQSEAAGTSALKAVLSWGQRHPWTTPNALNHPPTFVDPWLGPRQTWCGVPGTGQGGAHE
jgi:hypothetical protein